MIETTNSTRTSYGIYIVCAVCGLKKSTEQDEQPKAHERLRTTRRVEDRQPRTEGRPGVLPGHQQPTVPGECIVD